jgi:hypothetical protein
MTALLILIACAPATFDSPYSYGIDNDSSYDGIEAAVFAHETDQWAAIFPMDDYAILAGDVEGESDITAVALEVDQWHHLGMNGEAFVLVYEWRHVTLNAPGGAIPCPWDYITDEACYAVY